jgi:hypothetical protein
MVCLPIPPLPQDTQFMFRKNISQTVLVKAIFLHPEVVVRSDLVAESGAELQVWEQGCWWLELFLGLPVVFEPHWG